MPRRLWSRFNRNDDVATANASVVTARKSPRIRSAGSPMMIDATAPTAPARRKLRNGSRCQWTFAAPAAAAPIATNATWPRLISPAQPVRITSETAMIA